LAKEYDSLAGQPTEFEDEQLQAFFEIIKSDNYFVKTYNNNSEELRKIAIDIDRAIKGKISDQFLVNSVVKSNVIDALKKILRKKYNYPPNDLLKEAAKNFETSIISQVKAKKRKVYTQE
jgi:type I restriction enzyme R subunit